jgi:hypothetical protein
LAVLGSFNRADFWWSGIYGSSAIVKAASCSELPCDVLANSFGIDAPLLCTSGGKQADSPELARGDRSG